MEINKRRNLIAPRTLPGFMELLPAEQVLFNKMLDTIRSTYEMFGFIPLDTPIIEFAEILLAKAGGETEKQIYKFDKGDNELALRFDLTVPLAKYVSQYYHSLTFPFRRYQIGKVFRGERPQKGRFREFYQCDIDIIGDGELSIMNDAEIPSIIYQTFKRMGFENFTIRINNRKILNGFFEALGLSNKASDVLRIIDKIDKIGEDNVKAELLNIGINQASVDSTIRFLSIKGSNADIVSALESMSIDNAVYSKGIQELRDVLYYIKCFEVPEKNFTVDLTIARGLDYYTGTVYETILNDYPQIGSVCSGGRYDNLAEYYTEKNLPGVGISIGLTRLFYKLLESGVIKTANSSTAKVLIISMIDDMTYPLKLATELRSSGINTEIYYNNKGMKGKLTYANKLGIEFAAIIGEDEIKSGEISLKNMYTGEQQRLPVSEIIKIVS
ncbi:MAG: histidine--tRNA ligase [Deltaproteobacteria bacterium]